MPNLKTKSWMDFNVHVCLLSFGRNLAFSLIDLMFYLSLRLTNDIREVFRLDQVIQEVSIWDKLEIREWKNIYV